MIDNVGEPGAAGVPPRATMSWPRAGRLPRTGFAALRAGTRPGTPIGAASATGIRLERGGAEDLVNDRPLVIEIVGAWGAGKGTLLHCLNAADPSLRIDIDVWHLPRPLLVRGAFEAARTIAGLFANARKFLWTEAKLIIKLRAIQRQLRDPRLAAHSALVLDEGPVFALSGLHLAGHRAVGNGGLAAWWPRTLRHWAESVDIVVHLDAPDTVLARRIRDRPRFHPLQQSGDVEMFDTLRRYRSACERVLMGLTAYGGPSVMTFRTDQQTTPQIAQQVLAAIARARNGR